MQRTSFGFMDSSSTRFKIKLSLIYMIEQRVDCASTPEDKGARVQVSEPNYCLLATNIELFHGKLKRSHGRCRYYPNSVASCQILMMGGDISLNPGPLELKRKLNKNSRKPSCNTIHSITTKRCYRNSCLIRNRNNLNVAQHSKTPPQDNGLFQVCSLNARSLRNKSAALWTL